MQGSPKPTLTQGCPFFSFIFLSMSDIMSLLRLMLGGLMFVFRGYYGLHADNTDDNPEQIGTGAGFMLCGAGFWILDLCPSTLSSPSASLRAVVRSGLVRDDRVFCN